MAKRRTKAQKKKARVSYQLPAMDTVSEEKVKIKPTKVLGADSVAIMSYDTDLLKKDLVKTVIISAFILTLEFGLYWVLVIR